MNQTFAGRIVFKAIFSVVKKQIKAAEKMPEGPEKENSLKAAFFLRRSIENNSMRSLSMTAQSTLPYNRAQGIVALANGHIIKGAACFMKKIKVPKLPKDE